MKRQSLVLAIMILTLAGYVAVMPGCGDKTNQPVNNGYYNCQPGQVCVANAAAGIPLLNSTAIGFLEPVGAPDRSSIILSFGANNMTAGQAYVGPANISGVLHLRPGMCGGPGGDFQITGTGNWESGFGGYVARVAGTLTGGSVSVNLSPTLIAPMSPVNGSNYLLYYSPGVMISICGGYALPLYAPY